MLDLAASFELRSSVIEELVEMRRRIELRGHRLALVHLYLGARDAVAVSALSDLPAFATLDDAIAGLTVGPAVSDDCH